MADEVNDPAVVEYLRRRASRAGKARLTSMTAEDRRRVAKLAAQARWKKKKGGPDGGGSPDGSNGGNGGSRPISTGIMSTGRRLPKPCKSLRPSRKAVASFIGNLFKMEDDRAA